MPLVRLIWARLDAVRSIRIFLACHTLLLVPFAIGVNERIVGQIFEL